MAINKPAIIEAVFHGTGTQAKNLLPPGVWSADAELKIMTTTRKGQSAAAGGGH
jgi:ABC-type transport system substrate-binding protein